jgi:hypothetical protein
VEDVIGSEWTVHIHPNEDGHEWYVDAVRIRGEEEAPIFDWREGWGLTINAAIRTAIDAAKRDAVPASTKDPRSG